MHATVRDAAREDKVSYLEDMDASGPGSVVIFEAALCAPPPATST